MHDDHLTIFNLGILAGSLLAALVSLATALKIYKKLAESGLTTRPPPKRRTKKR